MNMRPPDDASLTNSLRRHAPHKPATQRPQLKCVCALLYALLICAPAMPATIHCFTYERSTGRAINGVEIVAISQGETQVTIGPAVTNEDGECDLRNIPAGQWQIVAVKIGYAVAIALVNVGEDEEVSVSLPVEPMPVLKGKVSTANGRPLPQTPIDVSVKGEMIEMHCTVRTDDDGNYSLWLGAQVKITVGGRVLTNMPSQEIKALSLRARGEAFSGCKLRLEARLSGFKAFFADVEIPKGASETEVNITLMPLGGQILGKLLNQRGEPIEGASLLLRSLVSGESLIARTDENGSFQFNGVEAGRYLLNLRGVEGAGKVTLQPKLIELKEGETLMLHLIATYFEPPTAVTFTLLRDGGKLPLSNEAVSVFMRMLSPQKAYGSSATLVTDGSGRCVMPIEKEPAVYRAVICASGWSVVTIVDARETRNPQIKILLPDKPQLLVRVMEQPDKPISAYVHLRANDELFWENIGSTDSNGFMRICGLPEGEYDLAATPKSIYAYSESLHSAVFTPVHVRVLKDEFEKPIEVTLKLPRCIKVAGKTITTKGTSEEPLPYATIRLERDGGSGNKFTLIASSNQDGYFEFSAVPLGNYTLRASHMACEESETRLNLIGKEVIGSGAVNVLVRLKYVGLGGISGKLVDGSGQPVRKATVSVLKPYGRGEYAFNTVETKEDGSFIITNLPAGQYSVELRASEGGITLRNIKVGGDKVTEVGVIKLPPPAVVVGKVKAHDESWLDELQVFACPPATVEHLLTYFQHSLTPPETIVKQTASIGGDGKFMLRLPAGEYELVVYGRPLLLPISKRLTLKPAERVFVEFTLPQLSQIEGQVKRIDNGEPVSMAIITVYTPSGRKIAQTVTDINGRYIIKNIPPGTYSVRCKGEGLAAAVRHHVKLDSGDCAIVDFNLSIGASVYGKIVRKGGEKTEFRFYQVLPNADASLASSVNQNGEFRIEHLSPGRHVIMVFMGGELVGAKEVILREGEEKHILIEF